MTEQEFSVSGFKQRSAFCSDRRKSHVYPEQRRHPRLNSSKKVKDMNLILNQTHNKVTVMNRNYVGTPAMREYSLNQKTQNQILF